ncbi:tetratricopeptide repeat protein [Elusimicrobiota bacterium]
MSPQKSQSYIRLGDWYMVKGEYETALKMYEKSSQVDPDNAKSYMRMAACLLTADKIEKVEDLYKKAIELNPYGSYSYCRLARFYTGQKRYGDAQAVLNNHINIAGMSGKVMTELGVCHLFNKDYESAVEAAGSALEFNDQDCRTWGLLMLSYQKLDNKEMMMQCAKTLNRIRGNKYKTLIASKYLKIYDAVIEKGARFVCAAYPLSSSEPFKEIFSNDNSVSFVDNDSVFYENIRDDNYGKYFIDMFAGNFGQCTPEGNRLLSENIAQELLKICRQ